MQMSNALTECAFKTINGNIGVSWSRSWAHEPYSFLRLQRRHRTLKAPPSTVRTPKAPPSTVRTPKAPPFTVRTQNAPPSTVRTPKTTPSTCRTLKAPPFTERTLKAPPTTEHTPKAPPFRQNSRIPKTFKVRNGFKDTPTSLQSAQKCLKPFVYRSKEILA